jgi:hypothetical protein
MKYYQSQKSKVLFMSFTLSLGLSVKYTFACFFLTAIIVILIKNFTNHKKIINTLITILNLILQTIVFCIFINYSIFFHPLNFFFDFAVNIANYDRPFLGGVSIYLFYLLSLTLIPVGISGLILLLVGVYFSIKKNLFRTNILILISPGLIFLILMSSGNLAGVRNMNLLLYIPFIFFAFALNELFEMKLVLGRCLAVLILIITASQTLYYTAQSYRKDARLQAAEWVNRNIAKTEKIGTNPGCGYKLPIDEDYEVIFDQDMKGNYSYYIFDMNWANTVFYSEYSKNSWYLEFNPDYISFYHGHNILPSKIFEFKGIKRDIKRHVPSGYSYKLVSGYGPDVIILFRV